MTNNFNFVNRRSFLKSAGGATAAAAAIAVSPNMLHGQTSAPPPVDTPQEMFTAALVAEDLATTFYAYALASPVMQDPNLAGPGGSTTSVAPGGSVSNVAYLRAALSEEIAHANLFRSLLGQKSAATDPYQQFYFPQLAFEQLSRFISALETLENAFIGAYLAAIQQFGLLAAQGKTLTFEGKQFTPAQLAYYATVAGSILGIESEHRALGRAIDPLSIPANNRNYAGTDGITSLFNGPHSAVAALTPFVTPGSDKMGCTLDVALSLAIELSIPTMGTIPRE